MTMIDPGRVQTMDEVQRVPIEAVMRVFVRKPGFLLSRVDQIANALYGGLGGGETLAQAELLLAIDAGGQRDQAGLARACGIDTSTTAIILDNLALTGLIARAQDAHDKRRSVPALTEAGRRRIGPVRVAFDQLQQAMISREGDGLVTLLSRIAAGSDHGAPRWDGAARPFGASPSFLCRRALQAAQARFNGCVAPDMITLRQFSALVILDLHPGISQVDYARLFGLDPSTCAIVLKKLVARRLLAVERSVDDRRKTLYTTTGEGRAKVADIQPLADRSEALMLAALTTAEADMLRNMLQDIVRHHSGRLRYPGILPWGDEGD